MTTKRKYFHFFCLKKKKDFKLTTTSVLSRSPRDRKEQFALWVLALPSQGQPERWVVIRIPS